MSQEEKVIESTVKQEAYQEIDDALKEMEQVNKDKSLKELKTFYRRMTIGQLSVAAIITTLVFVDKYRKSGDK